MFFTPRIRDQWLIQFAEMETGAGIGLYPLHRCKTIYLVSHVYLFQHFERFKDDLMFDHVQVRHAQGIHNVDGEKNYKAYMSHEYFDAELTQLGWQQVGKKDPTNFSLQFQFTEWWFLLVTGR